MMRSQTSPQVPSPPEMMTLPITYELIAQLMASFDQDCFEGLANHRTLLLKEQKELEKEIRNPKIFNEINTEAPEEQLSKDIRRISYNFNGTEVQGHTLYLDLINHKTPKGFSEADIFALFMMVHFVKSEVSQEGLVRAILHMSHLLNFYTIGYPAPKMTINVSKSKNEDLTINWQFEVRTTDIEGTVKVKHQSHIIKDNNDSYTYVPDEKNSFVKITGEVWKKIIEEADKHLTKLVQSAQTKNPDFLDGNLSNVYMLLPVLQAHSFREKFIKDFYLKQSNTTQNQIDEMITKCLPPDLVNLYKTSLPINNKTKPSDDSELAHAPLIKANSGAREDPVGSALDGAIAGVFNWIVFGGLTAILYHLGSFVLSGIKSVFKSYATPKKDKKKLENESQSNYSPTSSNTSSILGTVASDRKSFQEPLDFTTDPVEIPVPLPFSMPACSHNTLTFNAIAPVQPPTLRENSK